MASEERLGDHVAILTGFPFKSRHYVEDPSGVRLLRGDNIAQGRLRWDGAKRWPEGSLADYEAYQLAADDVVIAMDRPWIEAGLKYARLRHSDLPSLLVRRVARLRAHPTLEPRFLEYLVGSRDFTAYVQAVQTGTTVPHISQDQVAAFRFPYRPLKEQAAIAEVLGALDDKIDLLHRQCRTVEETVRALYRGLLRRSGERQLPISEIARYVNGGAFTKKADGHGRLIVRIAELSKGPGSASKYGSFEVGQDHLARPGDLLFSWSATLDVFRWSRDEAIINQHIFKVVCDQGWPSWFVYCALKDSMPYFRALAADKTTTMGHIKRGHLAQAEVTRPNTETLSQAGDAAEPLWQLQLQSLREAIVLEQLRDALLPQLLSGELRIPDAERLAEAVA